jgi:hypothetical protein
MAAGLTIQPSGTEVKALYSVLTIERPRGRGTVPIAILLVDVRGDNLYASFRRDLASLAEDEELDVLEGMEEDILTRAREQGACRLLAWFVDTLSGYVRITDPCPVSVDGNWKGTLDRLFEDHVDQEPG